MDSRDLQPYKTKLMELSYNEKIQMSEWLHKEMALEMGQAVKEKAKVVGQQLDTFLDKAAKITKTTGNDMLNTFRSATGGDKK